MRSYKLIFYNLLLSLIIVLILSLIISSVGITVSLLLFHSYFQFFISISVNVALLFLTLSKISLCLIVIVYLLASFIEWSLTNTLFELLETWDLRRFIRGAVGYHFNSFIMSSYVDSKNFTDVRWIIKLPLDINESIELSSKLDALYEYISYNHQGYIFSNFIRSGNHFILNGTLKK